MPMVCDFCFQVYDKEFDCCPKRNCTGQIVDIDELMLPIFIALNKKGYITKYSCAGHIYDDYPQCNIVFYNDCAPDFKDNPPPKGFKVKSLAEDTIAIFKMYKEGQEVGLFFAIMKTAKELYNWALDLPDCPEI